MGEEQPESDDKPEHREEDKEEKEKREEEQRERDILKRHHYRDTLERNYSHHFDIVMTLISTCLFVYVTFNPP